MVDREARNKLIKLIKSFMNDEIKSDQFDEEMTKITCNSDDRLVGNLYDELILGAPDNDINNVYKSGWDCLNRVILMLESDLESQYSPAKYRYLIVVFIIAAILGYIIFGYKFGTLVTFLAIHIPVAIYFNIKIHRLDSQQPQSKNCYPFPSYSLLAETRRKVTHFKKDKYKGPNTREISSEPDGAILRITIFVLSAIFAPLGFIFFLLTRLNGKTKFISHKDNTIPC